MRGLTSPLNLTGQKFGRLLVLDKLPSRKNRVRWLCVCDCGNTKEISTLGLRTTGTESCGCIRIECMVLLGKAQKIHGHASQSGKKQSRTYCTWMSMRRRCNDVTNHNYHRYGGRGIMVCKRWLDSFKNFLHDMEVRPEGKTLDRINNDGNYEPNNCRWATAIEQSRHRRKNESAL